MMISRRIFLKIDRKYTLPTLILLFLLLSLLFVSLKKCSLFVETEGPSFTTTTTTTNTLPSKTWIRISDSVFVYSAFLEMRDHSSPYIKIIGLKRVKKRSQKNVQLSSPIKTTTTPLVQDITKVKDVAEIRLKYYCKLFYEEGNKLQYIKSENLTYFLYEEGVKIYAGTFYKCFFKPKTIPSHGQLYIALYPRNIYGYPDKLIPVQRERLVHSTNLSVCVRPLFGPMDNLLKLAQFIAYYESQGVSHFIFYDLSISPKIRQFLKQLSNTNNHPVKLLQWNLPTGNSSELWDYGTLTALHDCIYQSVGFVIVVDIDEFIVPQQQTEVEGKGKEHSTLLNFVQNPAYQNIWQFSVRNTFFCDEFCTFKNSSNRTNDKIVEKYKEPLEELIIFSCPLRTKRIWGRSDRTKYIANAEKVLSIGHHYVTTFMSGAGDPKYARETFHVPSSLLLLNHYRQCTSISSRRNPIQRRATLKDDKIQQFRPQVESSSAFLVYRSFL